MKKKQKFLLQECPSDAFNLFSCSDGSDWIKNYFVQISELRKLFAFGSQI